MSSRPLQGLFVVAARTRSESCEIPNSCLQKEEIVACMGEFGVEGCAFKKVAPRRTLAVAARRDYPSNQSGLLYVPQTQANRDRSRSHPSACKNIKIRFTATSLPQIPLPMVKQSGVKLSTEGFLPPITRYNTNDASSTLPRKVTMAMASSAHVR